MTMSNVHIRPQRSPPQRSPPQRSPGNLDSVTGELILQALFALTHERHHTLILVTHNMELAGRCDRIIQLRDGRVES
jgi:predicted ABC-type transport system involved in lysophospholipase L1 biosynthesis ATPase subunit